LLKRITRFITIVAVNIIVLILLIAGIEFASSFFADKVGSNLLTVYRLNHTWKPNSERVHDEWLKDNPEFPEPYTHVYNRQGWIEDYDIEPAKPPNTYRIFYLGDSFTEGTLPMGQSIPSVVEQKLNELAQGKDIQFEVINTGTTSYSPTIFYVLTRYVLMDYAPDLIVVNVDMTDDFDDWKYAETLIRDNEGNPWAVPHRSVYKAPFIDTAEGVVKADTWIKLQLFLIEHSYTYNLIREYVAPQNANADPVAQIDDPQVYQRWAWCQKEWDESTVENVNHTLDLLQRLATFAHENDVKIMFTSVPHYWQYAGNEDGSGEPRWSSRPHDEIAMVAAGIGVPYLNAYEKLVPIITGTPQTDFYYKGDMHFNPRGYSIWAQIHVEFLAAEENHLLPDDFYE
jgi:lysophospholipase L1-like esterase